MVDDDSETATDEAETDPESDPATTTEEGVEEAKGERDANGDDEVPDLDPDEKADVPDQLAEKMADVSPDEGDSSDEGASEGDDSGDGTTSDTVPEEGAQGASKEASEVESTPGSHTWGEAYVDVLAIFLVEIAAELDDEEPDIDQDEIHDLATSGPVDLVEASGELFEEMGAGSEMSPAQATVAGSAFIAFGVLVRETDAAGQLVSKASKAVAEEGVSA